MMNQQANRSERGYALYRLPGDQSNVFLQGTVSGDESLHTSGAEGFVFAPFHASRRNRRVFLKQEDKKVWNGSAVEFLDAGALNAQWLLPEPEPTTGEYYLKSFHRMMEAIRQGAVRKVVLSKLVTFRGEVYSRVFELYDALCAQYPQAFVSLFASEETGIWVGASPELLLSMTNQQLHTVALAGTGTYPPKQEWKPKELDEQQLVTDFILEVLQRQGVIHPIMHGPETVRAGAMQHLKTSFHFGVPMGEFDFWKMAEALHPTPAVCGLPPKHARQLILEEEFHDREYYAGYLGPVGPDAMQLYVNIRCMKLTQGGAVLFTGGGLTSGSHAEEEWNETELKSRTLMAVLDSKYSDNE